MLKCQARTPEIGVSRTAVSPRSPGLQWFQNWRAWWSLSYPFLDNHLPAIPRGHCGITVHLGSRFLPSLTAQFNDIHAFAPSLWADA